MREELDRVSTDRPVREIHFFGYQGVDNSLAFKARGVNRNTPDPTGGWIGRGPEYRCEPSITRTEMVEKIAPLHKEGYQVHMHSNGDATSDVLLDAIEDDLAACPCDDHRHTLINARIQREDQLDCMARLGVPVSFFPAHLYYWGDFHCNITFGPDRVRHMSPTRWANERGIRFTIHNDAQVIPTRPMHLMRCAANRTSRSGTSLGKEQALTVREALRAHSLKTIVAASSRANGPICRSFFQHTG